MAKNAKTAATKGRETKLNKKTSEELIEIILRKDKTERNLSNQVVNLKAEVNSLQNRVNNFDADMEGTYQQCDALKDQVKALQERNDALKIEANDNMNLYKEEGVKLTQMKALASLWKGLAIMAGVAFAISIVCHVIF